jgi:hypothetical protein
MKTSVPARTVATAVPILIQIGATSNPPLLLAAAYETSVPARTTPQQGQLFQTETAWLQRPSGCDWLPAAGTLIQSAARHKYQPQHRLVQWNPAAARMTATENTTC